MDEPWKTLITLAAIVLLPVVPAFLLFRYLPSTGRAAGPLKGLNIKFTGAFAGYLTLFLSLLAVYRPKESPRGCFDDWTVSGQIAFQHDATAPDPNYSDVRVRVVPPALSLLNEGKFWFDISVPRDEQNRRTFPVLQFDLNGYRGLTVSLDPTSPKYGSLPLDIEHNEEEHTIKIRSNITMQALQPAESYSAATAQKPQAVQ